MISIFKKYGSKHVYTVWNKMKLKSFYVSFCTFCNIRLYTDSFLQCCSEGYCYTLPLSISIFIISACPSTFDDFLAIFWFSNRALMHIHTCPFLPIPLIFFCLKCQKLVRTFLDSNACGEMGFARGRVIMINLSCQPSRRENQPFYI